MASKLVWKVYAGSEMIAATASAEDAAVLMASYENGAFVKKDGRLVWAEGLEPFEASASYDGAAMVMYQRDLRNRVERYERITGKKVEGYVHQETVRVNGFDVSTIAPNRAKGRGGK